MTENTKDDDWVDRYLERRRRMKRTMHYVESYCEDECVFCHLNYRDSRQSYTNDLNLWKSDEYRCTKAEPIL